jgi:tetratricopeptide (TPR) repeat protein
MANSFYIPETIFLNPDTAGSFGILAKSEAKDPVKEEKEVISIPVQVLKIEESEKKIVVTLKLEDKEVQIPYKKAELNRMKNLFIGWAYLLISEEDYKTRDENKKKATEYLKEASKPIRDEEEGPDDDDEPSPLAHYLISKYDLNISWAKSHRLELYHHFNKGKPLFRDFYHQLIYREPTQLRKIMIAQKALEYYPNDGFFIELIASDLFHQKRYLDCIEFITERKKHFSDDEWIEMDTLRITLIRTYNQEKMYDEALEELQTNIRAFSTDYTNLLRGTVYHQQKNFPEAIKAFEQVVVEDYINHDAAIIATYYLLECYLLNKNTYKLSNIIDSFALDDHQVYLFGHEPYKEKEIIKMFERVLASKEIDDRLLAKVKIMYAYLLQEGLQFGQGEKEPLTKDEKEILEKSLNLLTEALPFHKGSAFANGLYSNLLRTNEDYDQAMDYKLKSISNDKNSSSYYVGAELEETSEKYMNNYPEHFKKFLEENGGTIPAYIENMGFDFDVGGLWKHKKYKQIVELYKLVKPHIHDDSNFGHMSGHTSAGDWFDVAYSLSEAGDTKECIILYEKILKDDAENSSVLNNLAILYEKFGDMGKAKSLIQKAKKLVPEDEVVNRNYTRLTSAKKGKEVASAKNEVEIPKEENNEPKTVIDGSIGYLVLGKHKINVGASKNVPFKLLQTLCPFGKAKGISAVYNQTNTERSKLKGLDLSLDEKVVQLRLRLKELQECLRPKVRVSLTFNRQDETVFLEYQLRG